MSSKVKARIFNIMQYEVHPETGEKLIDEDIIKVAISHRSIREYAYVRHDKDVYSEADNIANEKHIQGQPKPPHWHIVLKCANAVEVGSIARWLQIPDNFVDVPKGLGAGKFLDCVEYLTHESERQRGLGKYRYDDKEVRCNFDFRARLNKRNENKLKYGRDLDEKEQMEYDVLYLGKTLKQCKSENKLLYMSLYPILQKHRMAWISEQKPPYTRLNYYVTGDGGIGKGLICRALARAMYPQIEDDEDIFFEVGAKGAPFEGYDGQPVIIWNDRRAVDLLQELNGRGNVFNVFDTHPTKQRQNVKFSSVCLCNTVNIVNSVQPYIDFLEGLSGGYTDRNGDVHKAEDKSQSYRRFPFMIVLHEDDFDLMLNKGFFENTRDFEEYIQYSRVRGSAKKIREACGNNEELAKEIETQYVAPVIGLHKDTLTKFERDVVDEDEVRRQFETYGQAIK